MEADDVAAGRQLLQWQVGDAIALLLIRRTAGAAVIVHLAAKGGQPLRRSLCNVAKAYQTNPAGGQLRQAPGHTLLLDLHLPALPDRPVSGDGAAQEHQHQQDGLFRHGAGVAALVVAHPDAPLPGGIKVDLVIGHALGLDELQLRHPADEGAGDRRDGIREDDARVRRPGENFFLAAVPVQKDQFLLPDKRQRRKIRLITGSGAQNEYFHHVVHLLSQNGCSSL